MRNLLVKSSLFILGILILFAPIDIYPSSSEDQTHVIRIAGSEAFMGNPESANVLISPYSIAMDASQSLFISDLGAQCIYELEPSGSISLFAGTTNLEQSRDQVAETEAPPQMPAGTALIQAPAGIALDIKRKRLLIADMATHKIYYVDKEGELHTLVGSGQSGYNGDGFFPRRKSLNQPRDVAVDNHGNVYIADALNHRVRRLGRFGRIVTIAGNGESGFSGDGGPALEAQLNEPSGIAVDSEGSIYVADTLNHRVRRIGKDGSIVTIAGNGEPGFSGNGEPASAAQLNSPTGIAIDANNNIYITDILNRCVRKIDTQGVIRNVITGLDQPTDVFAAPNGDVYIAESREGRIILLRANGKRLFFKGQQWRDMEIREQPALEISLSDPAGLDVAQDGSIFFVDRRLSRIYRYTADGIVWPIAGNGIYGYTGDGGPALEASLRAPTGVLVGRDGSLFIADTSNHCIRKVTTDGDIQTIAGNGEPGFSGDNGPAVDAQMSSPNIGLATDRDGNLFIADSGNNRIRMISPDGLIRTVVGGGSQRPTQAGVSVLKARLRTPQGIALSESGDLYISEASSGIQIVDEQTGMVRPWIDLSPGKGLSLDLDVDSQGNIYLAETYQHQITCWSGNEQKRLLAKGHEPPKIAEEDQPYDIALEGAKPGSFNFPIGIQLTRDGNLVFTASQGLYMAMGVAEKSKPNVWPVSPAFVRHLDFEAIERERQQNRIVEAEIGEAFQRFQHALSSENPQHLRDIFSHKTLQVMDELDKLTGEGSNSLSKQMQQAAKGQLLSSSYSVQVEGGRARIVLADSPTAIYELIYESDSWKFDMSASIEALLERFKSFGQEPSSKRTTTKPQENTERQKDS